MTCRTILLPILVPALAFLGGCGEAPAAPRDAARPATHGDAAHPVVVELFQSQGCSSCPPANANINALADRPDLLVLSFGVTYWDQLGWRDTFASPANTARQWDYARAGGRGNVSTPQVIVNGGQAIVGSNRAQLEQVIAKAGPLRGRAMLSLANGRAAAVDAPTNSVLWLVRYDPRERQVAIRAGENNGRKLPHRNVVRQLVALGSPISGRLNAALPKPNEPGLTTALMLQQGRGGPIVAAVRGGKT